MPPLKGYPIHLWDRETGELVVVNSPEDNRDGLLPFHPEDTEKAERAAAAGQGWTAPPPPPVDPGNGSGEGSGPVITKEDIPMTREEIKAALDKGNVPYAANASNVVLYTLLCEKLREFLTQQGNGNIPEDADAPTMLAMLAGAA